MGGYCEYLGANIDLNGCAKVCKSDPNKTRIEYDIPLPKNNELKYFSNKELDISKKIENNKMKCQQLKKCENNYIQIKCKYLIGLSDIEYPLSSFFCNKCKNNRKYIYNNVNKIYIYFIIKIGKCNIEKIIKYFDKNFIKELILLAANSGFYDKKDLLSIAKKYKLDKD